MVLATSQIFRRSSLATLIICSRSSVGTPCCTKVFWKISTGTQPAPEAKCRNVELSKSRGYPEMFFFLMGKMRIVHWNILEYAIAHFQTNPYAKPCHRLSQQHLMHQISNQTLDLSKKSFGTGAPDLSNPGWVSSRCEVVHCVHPCCSHSGKFPGPAIRRAFGNTSQSR